MSGEVNFPPSQVDLATFKVEVESDYIGTGVCHRPTSSQSLGLYWPLAGNRTGKLRVRVYPLVGSGRNFRLGSYMVTGKQIGYGYRSGS